MLKFFLLSLFFSAIRISSLLAQDFNNSSFQKNNIYSNYYNNYQDNIESYQLNYASPSAPNKYGNSLANDYDTTQYNKPKNNDYANSFNAVVPTANTKKYTNFKDGKGVGYRVYDNSNRQSYFCDLAPSTKKKFTHDNNFNGVYFGVGIAKIDSTVDFSQNSRTSSQVGPQESIPSYKFNFSGSKSLPSIVIGQGRLFSSGLFLGQEYAMNIGEFKVGSNKIDNGEYKKINYSFSNYSYYSGKFGFNIFKIFIPYVKLALSMSTSRFIVQKSDETKMINSGSYPSIGVGAGIDISIQDHLRAIIDYTQFSGSGDGFASSVKSTSSKVIINTTSFDSTYSFTRASLIYKF